MNIWVVSMEYAGIAEAGGVKNVACSLSEEFDRCGHHVTVFIPVFSCTSFDLIDTLSENCVSPAVIDICGQRKTVSYTSGKIQGTGITVIFICHPLFAEKQAVYTYTAAEEELNPDHKRGCGHADMLLLDALFQRAVVLYGSKITENHPDIIHCHDAATAVIPAYINKIKEETYFHTACVVTIHNAGPAYHHEFPTLNEAFNYTGLPEVILKKALNGKRVEPYLLAAAGGAVLTTVSEDYAAELVDPLYSDATDGLSKQFSKLEIPITGITNGIDYERYNPVNNQKSLLPFSYNPEKGKLEGKYQCLSFLLSRFSQQQESELHAESVRFLSGLTRSGWIFPGDPQETVFFAYHGRLVTQKGITVLEKAAELVIEKNKNVRFILIGQGEPELENDIEKMTIKFPGFVVFFKGYNRIMARLVSASCDYIVLPSNFEPCGLEDFIAQIFGTIPIAHATGGLKKIINGIDGFLYKPNDPETLATEMMKCADWKQKHHSDFLKMISNAAEYVHNTYDWHEIVVRNYMPFFESLLTKNKDFNNITNVR
jgi:starch synthase